VAFTAKKLGKMTGYSKNECNLLLIAGYLHDLGKLAIPNSLLEKPGSLTKSEFDLIRCHTFYTYQLLDSIGGFQTINQWASFHHEKLDGSGYPFHLTGEDIPLGSRILAVSDVFTAITEDRPYRKGMDKSEVIKVMQTMADNGSLTPEIVALLLKELDSFTQGCKEVQKQAEKEYEDFFQV
jgi:HD-GYP domain-containing protein (c-di-GMP phosphodiesterase class II)